MERTKTAKYENFGISLTGGGARGSYQAGVILGLMEILKEQNLLGTNNPFQYWSGASAGSINATFCAAGLDDFESTARQLVELWSNIKSEQVFLTNFSSLTVNSAKWIRDLTFGPMFKNKIAKSLLETDPLWDTLKKHIKFEQIQSNIESGHLKGLACSAYSYLDNRTVTFLQTNEHCQWNKPKRYSKKLHILPEHVMASCAIPLLFPSVTIGGEYFADGSFRNTTPISPMIHMGAKKILVIGVRGPNEIVKENTPHEPGLAKVAGIILNALFFDTIDIDVERLKHVNEMVRAVQKDIVTNRSDYSEIDFKMIRPSRDLSRMAENKTKNFPKMINFFMSGIGGGSESSELASYILFESEFTKDLIDLGYNDVKKQKNILMRWFEY